MTSKHDDTQDREKRLLALLTGQVDPESPEGRDLLDRDPELRKAFEEVRRLPGCLDEMADQESETLRSLPDAPPPSPVVDRALERVWAEEDRGAVRPPSNRNRVILSVAILAAAAGILLLLTFWDAGEDPGARTPTYLEGSVTVLTQDPVVDRFRFAWEDMLLGPRGLYRIRALVNGEEVTLWEGSATSWSPTAEEAKDWPDRLTWWVEGYYGPVVSNQDPDFESAKITQTRRSD